MASRSLLTRVASAAPGVALVVAVGVMAGCAVFGPPRPRAIEPATVSAAHAVSAGARRASLALVLDGLEADADGRRVRAQGSYDRALQVDPTNPYAYLAIARHRIEGGEAREAHAFLDRAVALFEAQGGVLPEVEVFLVGLRGEALVATGDVSRAFRLQERARELSPAVWSDDHLSAEELM